MIAYSTLERTHRPVLKKLLSSLENPSENEGSDAFTPHFTLPSSDVVALKLLSELLIPKTKKERIIHSIKVNQHVNVVCVSVILIYEGNYWLIETQWPLSWGQAQ